MSRRIGRLIATFGLLGLLVTHFQNCAPEGAFESSSLSSQKAHDGGEYEEIHREPKKIGIISFSPPLADREVVETILTHAFGREFRFRDLANVELQGTNFGKMCSLYGEYYVKVNGQRSLSAKAELCRNSSPNFIAGALSAASTPRSGYLMKACSDLVSANGTFSYFLNQVGPINERNTFNDASLKKAYGLFFVGKPAPTQSLLDAMRFVSQSQSDKNKAWSAIAYSLCSSGLWQVL